MNKLIATITFLPILFTAMAQDAETEIRRLENIEHKAMMEQDTATLSGIVDEDIIVTTPTHKIVRGRKKVFDMKRAGARFLSFKREVEQVVINGDVSFSMGNETAVTSSGKTNTQEISKRRYTNVWMKKNGTWRLTARHASEICKP